MCAARILYYFFSPFTRLSIFALCSFSPLLSPLFLSHTPYLNRFLPTLRSAKSRSGFSRAFNYGIRSGPGPMYLGTFLFLQTRKAGSLWLGFVSCDRYAAAVRLVENLPEYFICVTATESARCMLPTAELFVRLLHPIVVLLHLPPFPNKNRTPMCTEGLPHFPLCERAFLD